MSDGVRELARNYAEACARACACAKSKGEVSPQIRTAITRTFNRAWDAAMQNGIGVIEFGDMLREEQRKAQSV